MKRVKVTLRAGEKERGIVRLRKGDSAIVFTTSTGQKIEVDLMETATGAILLRSHAGAVKVADHNGTLEVAARPLTP